MQHGVGRCRPWWPAPRRRSPACGLRGAPPRASGPATFLPSTQAAASRTTRSMWPLRCPVGVEHRALGRDVDVAVQRRHDLVVPEAVGEVGEGGGVEHGFCGAGSGFAAGVPVTQARSAGIPSAASIVSRKAIHEAIGPLHGSSVCCACWPVAPRVPPPEALRPPLHLFEDALRGADARVDAAEVFALQPGDEALPRASTSRRSCAARGASAGWSMRCTARPSCGSTTTPSRRATRPGLRRARRQLPVAGGDDGGAGQAPQLPVRYQASSAMKPGAAAATCRSSTATSTSRSAGAWSITSPAPTATARCASTSARCRRAAAALLRQVSEVDHRGDVHEQPRRRGAGARRTRQRLRLCARGGDPGPGLPGAYNTLGVVYQRRGLAGRCRARATATRSSATPSTRRACRTWRSCSTARAAAPRRRRCAQRLARLEAEPPFHHFDLGRAAAQAGDYRSAREHIAARDAARPATTTSSISGSRWPCSAWVRSKQARAHLTTAMKNSTTRARAGALRVQAAAPDRSGQRTDADLRPPPQSAVQP